MQCEVCSSLELKSDYCSPPRKSKTEIFETTHLRYAVCNMQWAVCSVTYLCVHLACTSTNIHSTCKPEKTSYPTSKSKGKMAAMQKLPTTDHASAHLSMCRCTHTCIRTWVEKTLASNLNGKRQNGRHAKTSNNTSRTYIPAPVPFCMPSGTSRRT